MPLDPNTPIAIIGLGYVGLPLAVEFAKKRKVIGFDINAARIAELEQGRDSTREVEPEELQQVIGLGPGATPEAWRHAVGHDVGAAPEPGKTAAIEMFGSPAEGARPAGLSLTTDPDDLRRCTCFIVTVPTPIDAHKRPDLTPLIKASETVGRVLKPGDIVIYESTVYPGCTEEDCVPILERESGLKFISATPGSPQGLAPRDDADAPSLRGTSPFDARSEAKWRESDAAIDAQGFYAGYSPERINPGDKLHRVTNIKKVTAGSTPEIAETIDALYREIITAGTHKAESICVAEAAKVIENTQRDLNIALMNELSVLFDRMNIDTRAVLEAAGTKWNFLPFRPGLVGGHCIGVDPYYLTHKAEKIGYTPQVILSGRRINDNMGRYVARATVKKMVQNGIDLGQATIGVMGLTFKENCPDLRNSRVIDIIRELEDYGLRVVAEDPWADPADLAHEYPGLEIAAITERHPVDALIVAVGHEEYAGLTPGALRRCLKGQRPVLADVKSIYNRAALRQAGVTVWRL